MKKNRIMNFIPFIGDISFLIIGFFVSFIVVQYMLIMKAERPKELAIDQYFSSAEWKLDSLNRIELKIHISDSLFPGIKEKFDNGKLRAVRIEGHTDIKQPGPRQLSNRELSLKRAFEVSKVFEDIADDIWVDQNTLKNFLGMLSPTGKGEYHQKYGYKKIGDEYFIFQNDTLKMEKKGPFYTRLEADSVSLMMNRRIEIITVYQ
tara:strand:+ start:78 stop:692 length:615 start_codon:yes stop_codon:yes gene_type:complete